MAWENKRKIHVARGSTANIVALDNEEENKFTDGQPLFNKDRGYLGIATGTQEAKNIVPIKVREVTGWTNELDSNGVYTLNNTQDGYYSFGSGKDGNVHLATQKDFILERAIKPNQGNAYTFSTIFEYLVQNNKLNFNVPIETNNDIKIIGNDKKIQAINAQINNLNDTSGKTAIALSNNYGILLEDYNNNINANWSIKASALFGSKLANMGVVIGEYMPETDPPVSPAKALLYSGARTILLGNTDIQGTNYIGGKTTIGYGQKVSVNGEVIDDPADKLIINVPVELADSATLSAGDILLADNDISGISTLTAGTLLCDKIGNSSIKPSIMATSISGTNITASNTVTASTTLYAGGSGSYASLYVTSSNIKANSNIDASGKNITCNQLEVNYINLVV